MFVTKNLNCYKMANNGWISIVKVSIGANGYSASNQHFIIFKNGPSIKIPLGFSYLTLYDSPKRPIGKLERGPKAPSVGPYESGAPVLRRSEKEGGCRPPELSRYINFYMVYHAVPCSSDPSACISVQSYLRNNARMQ